MQLTCPFIGEMAATRREFSRPRHAASNCKNRYIRTPHKTAWEKGTVPVLLRGLRKRGTVPGGFVRGSRDREKISPAAQEDLRVAFDERRRFRLFGRCRKGGL